MRYVPAIVLAVVSGLFFWCATPQPGGVNSNVIMLLPAAFFGLLALVSGAIAYL